MKSASLVIENGCAPMKKMRRSNGLLNSGACCPAAKRCAFLGSALALATHSPLPSASASAAPFIFADKAQRLARAIAAELGHSLLEVACEDKDDAPIRGERRLRALRAAYALLQGGPMLIADMSWPA